MKLIDAIFERCSYRGLYKDLPIARDDLTLILRAGLAAPSGCNKQSTSIIAVDDKAILKAFGEILNKRNITSAPAIICVLSEKIYVNSHTSYYKQDYAAAVENMLLAITALGYKSCWIEGQICDNTDNGKRMAKILGVPDNYELVVILPVGIADEDLMRKDKKLFEERAWFNGYKNI